MHVCVCRWCCAPCLSCARVERMLSALQAGVRDAHTSKLRCSKPQISEVELRVRKVLSAAFKEIDVNDDGLLSEEELVDMMIRSTSVETEEQARAEARGIIQQLDKNNDSLVSRDEWQMLEDRIMEELMDWVRDIDSAEVVERELKRYERKFKTTFGMSTPEVKMPPRAG